ncbi:lipoyl domain-containing protein [Halobaculum magnesiiphilum]|uniref:Lipoyl domain-containing protein n=1 Tax=Halobaculum magnesiiphilum TaxID=1017351 RepID=A0A8T8WIS4_9EURY|nr:lipoyl domain-containing protein [Halobaculum magnesiiphilum]QZP39727.1 lipoyl domain-containing protein [Halobaculum magnesiiphilum]
MSRRDPHIDGGLTTATDGGDDRVPVDSGALWPGDTDDDVGLLLNWFVSEGSRVSEGDRIAEFQVEKVDVDVPAPASGTLAEIVVDEDGEFDRGDVLGYVEPEG